MPAVSEKFKAEFPRAWRLEFDCSDDVHVHIETSRSDDGVGTIAVNSTGQGLEVDYNSATGYLF